MTFHIYRSEKDRQWYWRLKASNGKKIGDSGEGYKAKRSAIKAVFKIQKEAGTSKITFNKAGTWIEEENRRLEEGLKRLKQSQTKQWDQ